MRTQCDTVLPTLRQRQAMPVAKPQPRPRPCTSRGGGLRLDKPEPTPARDWLAGMATAGGQCLSQARPATCKPSLWRKLAELVAYLLPARR
jgi:hypothetical protein